MKKGRRKINILLNGFTKQDKALLMKSVREDQDEKYPFSFY